MRAQTFAYLTILVLSSIFFCSCTKSCSNPIDHTGFINIAVSSPIETLDARYATSANSLRISGLVFAPLLTLGDDLSPQPFLAKSIEILDEKTFKITLHPNLKFHDGTPITADDVVYTFDQLSSKNVSSPHAQKFNYLKDIQKISPTEVIFELKKVFAPFLTDICALGIVSKNSCLGRSQECRHEYNGSGPFKVKEWNKAKEEIIFEPFADWWEGAPKNPLFVRIVRDENTRLLELMGQKTDLVQGDISPQNILELKKQAYLDVEQIAGTGYSYLAINVRGPKKNDKENSESYLTHKALASIKVRKAIAHAIDFDKIIEKILLGTAKRVSGLIPNGHWAKDPSLKVPAYDPKKAEKELDEAGFPRLSGHRPRFQLTIATTPNRMRQGIAQLYADYLGKIGIEVNIRVKDWGALYQDMKQGNFDLFSAIWVPVTEPDLYHWVHHSENIPDLDGSGGNRHGYRNQKVDKLIEQARSIISPQERKMLYHQIEQILLDELPYIPLWNEDQIVIYNKIRLHNFKAHPTGSLLGLRKAYIEPLKKKANN
ncbi:MAG: ABC transporter substrate-binding protein [Myxococcales bacterium]|nr:ABC transporter substrate-binding protein [Myxococcales bacterium]USN50642.1 MAG: ABC transporter substrate-binding protein [Myxococcales bacterium]